MLSINDLRFHLKKIEEEHNYTQTKSKTGNCKDNKLIE